MNQCFTTSDLTRIQLEFNLKFITTGHPGIVLDKLKKLTFMFLNFGFPYDRFLAVIELDWLKISKNHVIPIVFSMSILNIMCNIYR